MGCFSNGSPSSSTLSLSHPVSTRVATLPLGPTAPLRRRASSQGGGRRLFRREDNRDIESALVSSTDYGDWDSLSGAGPVLLRPAVQMAARSALVVPRCRNSRAARRYRAVGPKVY